MLMSDFFKPIGQILPFKAHLGFTSFSNGESNNNKFEQIRTSAASNTFYLVEGKGRWGNGRCQIDVYVSKRNRP